MSRTLRCAALLAAVAMASPLYAQDPLTVRTFALRSMRPDVAARLVSPYVLSANGGVYEVGGNVQAITVRETPAVLARVDSLLRLYDRTPSTLVLRFDLIAAFDSAQRDPAIEDIQAALRGLFRYPGYRLLAQGSTTTAEHSDFSLTLGSDGYQYVLSGEVGGVETGDAGRRLHLDVRLFRPAVDVGGPRAPTSTTLFSTGLSLPLGQTVVLGSAAPGGKMQAVIVVVRPELAAAERR